MSKETIIGIDLGTTNSCVAVMKDGRIEIIANSQGNRTTPSWVAFTESERLLGEAAKSQVNSNLKNTVYDTKRMIGRKFSDKEVQEELGVFTFDVSSGKSDSPEIIGHTKFGISAASI